MTGTSLLHYDILDKIGEGGMGSVYRARDRRLDRLVAIKFMPADAVGDMTDAAAFSMKREPRPR